MEALMYNDIQWLPGLVIYDENEHKTYPIYFQILYAIFKNDFIVNKPQFQKLNVIVDKTKGSDGIENIFHHITCGGDLEKPDLNRCARIAWNRPIIENSPCDEIKIWQNKRTGNRHSYCLLLDKENFFIVLLDLKTHVKLVTAYCVEKKHTKEKLLKEYTEYKKEGAVLTKQNVPSTLSTHGR